MQWTRLRPQTRFSNNGYTVLGGSSIGGGESPTKSHVASIVPGSSGGGTKTKANTTVVIVDENGADVSGATVTGTFSGSHNQTITATTGSNGSALLQTSVTSDSVAFTFCVNNVSHASLTYDPAANAETCDAY